MISVSFKVLLSRQLHTSSACLRKDAAHRGFWYSNDNRKGKRAPPAREVVDGALKRGKLRYSYKGKEKYEYSPRSPTQTTTERPHFGQYTRTTGPPIEWNPECAYKLSVTAPERVHARDVKKIQRTEREFGRREYTSFIYKTEPRPCSFIDPIVWRFIEKLKLTFDGGVPNAFDVMLEVFELIKLHQLALKTKHPEQEIELDCNKILEQAVKNVSPAIEIRFVEVIKVNDGYKPCPVPVTQDKGTNIAIKRFKMVSKHRRKASVSSAKLAVNIVDAYNCRGKVWDMLVEDVKMGNKFKDLYHKFGPVSRHAAPPSRGRVTHHREVLNKTMPLTAEEYATPPGEPMWHNHHLLDLEDRP